MKYTLTLFALLICSIANAQSQTKRVLFLGNSYTNVNNLPQMLADIAASTGDTLVFDSNTPGGYTLKGHSTNATSLAKLAAGNWGSTEIAGGGKKSITQRSETPDKGKNSRL